MKSEARKKMLVVRVNDAEFEKIEKLRKKTTERSLSSYHRKLLLNKPVIVKYRNESADDFLKEMLQLKKELNAIGNNFNQAVHKLHLLDKIPEFRSWLHQYDEVQKMIVRRIDEIKKKLQEIYNAWSLK